MSKPSRQQDFEIVFTPEMIAKYDGMAPPAIGIELAKNSFSVYGVDAKGKPVLQRTLTRAGVIRFFANLPECLVGMEACASSEYWARTIESVGHTVRRIHPRYVKAYCRVFNFGIQRELRAFLFHGG